jgi:hypothetical protein
MDSGRDNALMPIPIMSSDASVLRSALQTAEQFARQFEGGETAGIAFLGALVRGYFDKHADIDIAIFTNDEHGTSAVPQYQSINGFEIHSHIAGLMGATSEIWDMPKRWAFSESRIVYDPEGKTQKLLQDKVPLQPQERRWLLVSGITLSEWYINRLTRMWVDRGSLTSAHTMFNEGINRFYDMLFGLNNQLVADHKWRSYYAERLSILPTDFTDCMKQVLVCNAITENELLRRRAAYMSMWNEMLPLVEEEVHSNYEEFKNTV